MSIKVAVLFLCVHTKELYLNMESQQIHKDQVTGRLGRDSLLA